MNRLLVLSMAVCLITTYGCAAEGKNRPPPRPNPVAAQPQKPNLLPSGYATTHEPASAPADRKERATTTIEIK